MPNYYTSTRNPIARAGIIRALMKKGYALLSCFTISDYFRKFPAEDWPIVMVRFDGEHQNKPFIDLIKNGSALPAGCVHISPAQIDKFPPALSFPSPAKYRISYAKTDGTVGNYTISNPIEANRDSITAYAFGRGVRTFIKKQVRSLAKVA